MKLIKMVIKLRKWIWSPILAFLEKKSYPNIYKIGKEKLKEAKEKCKNIDEYVNYAQENQIFWRADPLFGVIDYTSVPEITLGKGCGDCDDLARVAINILKDHYQEVYELYTFPAPFEGHIMALFYDGEKWQLLSNTLCIYEAFTDEDIMERAARAYAGSRLMFYHAERVK